jgi:Protein of unknown function (DUF2004)
MTSVTDEINRRERVAREAIRDSFGTEEGEFGATIFVSHHLDELDAAYWLQHLGTKEPQPIQVLDILTLRSHWGDDEHEMKFFDFSLPGEVTQYVLSVRFDEAGGVEGISMES